MASSERVYEDFVPPHQMEREPATHTLTVNLSAQGYKKEHIRVQMVHSHRRLIVRGERPVDDGDGKRWSRFRLELRVPDGCDAKAIHARFDNGVVRVTMPGAMPEPVMVVDSVTGTGTGKQQQQPPPSPSPTTPKQHASSTAAAAGGDVQDGASGDRAAARRGQEDDDKHETPRKQEARQRVVSSAKDAAGGGGSSGSGDDTDGAGDVTAASLSSRQGYGFIHNRKQMATTVLGVVLVLISFGIYVRYSVRP